MIEIFLLEQLVAFSACGTLSRAAEELHITQPALSRSMKKLETAFGVSFFDREKSRISLNETGKDQIAVILRKMSAHQIFRQPRAALHRQANRTVLIQHDKIRNICKSVILRHLIMHGRADALTAVCGVILHNCPVYLDAFSLDSRLRAAGTVDGMPGRTKGKATTFPVMALSVFRSVLRSEIS